MILACQLRDKLNWDKCRGDRKPLPLTKTDIAHKYVKHVILTHCKITRVKSSLSNYGQYKNVQFPSVYVTVYLFKRRNQQINALTTKL